MKRPDSEKARSGLALRFRAKSLNSGRGPNKVDRLTFGQGRTKLLLGGATNLITEVICYD